MTATAADYRITFFEPFDGSIEMSKLGFVGLGIMGAPMAAHLRSEERRVGKECRL